MAKIIVAYMNPKSKNHPPLLKYQWNLSFIAFALESKLEQNRGLPEKRIYHSVEVLENYQVQMAMIKQEV